MNLVWTWWGVPGTFAFVAAWGCAVVALRTNPRRTLNQKLSLILFLEGLFAAGAIGLLFFFDDPAIITAMVAVGTAAMVALPFQYLSFLAVSLHTPPVALASAQSILQWRQRCSRSSRSQERTIQELRFLQ